MTSFLIEKFNIDIYTCPTAEITNATEISIGDLHANAMFLMHFLVINGVIYISDEKYFLLKNIYIKPQLDLTRSDIEAFNMIIDESIIGAKPLIRLLGDEICDRGQNDYFIFKILDKLKKSDVQIEILLSNHGIEFLLRYEMEEELIAHHIRSDQSGSMCSMKNLIDRHVITYDELDALVNPSYLPSLKLMSYSLHDNNITLYSHAGIGLETIQAFAAKFRDEGVVYQDDTAADLGQTIDAINFVFAKYVNLGAFHTLTLVINKLHNVEHDPINFLIWNRNYRNLQRDKVHNGYQLYFVHGHDSKESSHHNIFNLDNPCFKSADANWGTYAILGAREGPVAEFKLAEYVKDIYETDGYESWLSLEKLQLRTDSTYHAIPEDVLFGPKDFYIRQDAREYAVLKAGKLLITFCSNFMGNFNAEVFYLDINSMQKHALIIFSDEQNSGFYFDSLFPFELDTVIDTPVNHSNLAQQWMLNELAKRVRPFILQLCFGKEIDQADFQSSLTDLLTFRQATHEGADIATESGVYIAAHLKLWESIYAFREESYCLLRLISNINPAKSNETKRVISSRFFNLKILATSLFHETLEYKKITLKDELLALLESNRQYFQTAALPSEIIIQRLDEIFINIYELFSEDHGTRPVHLSFG